MEGRKCYLAQSTFNAEAVDEAVPAWVLFEPVPENTSNVDLSFCTLLWCKHQRFVGFAGDTHLLRRCSRFGPEIPAGHVCMQITN